jgi:hypothetical protein
MASFQVFLQGAARLRRGKSRIRTTEWQVKVQIHFPVQGLVLPEPHGASGGPRVSPGLELEELREKRVKGWHSSMGPQAQVEVCVGGDVTGEF